MTDPPKNARVAAYYRCSDPGQVHSVAGQKGVIRQKAKQKEWQLVAEYQDEGESGATTDNRPGLQQLIADAAAGKFNRLLLKPGES